MEDITKRGKMEEALGKAADEWTRTFDAISDAVFIQDKDNVIIKANKALSNLLGLKQEDIVGKKCYEVLHKMNKPWPNCPFEKTKKDFKPHTEEVDDPNLGKPLLMAISPIFDDKGNFTGAVHIAKDISEFKKMEKELRDKIEHLERFQKVTVDRELKMKELKARIAELEKRLGARKEG